MELSAETTVSIKLKKSECIIHAIIKSRVIIGISMKCLDTIIVNLDKTYITPKLLKNASPLVILNV